MADIKPVGNDAVSGQSKELSDSDVLKVSNIDGNSNLTITTGSDIVMDAGSASTIKIGCSGGTQAIAIGEGFDSPGPGEIWIEPAQASQAAITIQGAFGDITTPGGDISIYGGAVDVGTEAAGHVYIGGGGDVSGTATPGNVRIEGGYTEDTGPGGIVYILPGEPTTDNLWGNVYVGSEEPYPLDKTSYVVGIQGPLNCDNSGVFISGADNDDPDSIAGPVLVQGGDNLGDGSGQSFGGTITIKGGIGRGENGAGGDVNIWGGEGQAAATPGNVNIGDVYTTTITIGEDGNSSQTVNIYNANLGNATSQTTIGGALSCGDALAEAGLIKVRPGGTTIGGTVGPPVTLGALYYNPQNGQYVEVGNTIYLDGNGINNEIRAADGDDLDTFLSDEIPNSGDTYNLAGAGAIAASALEPGSVTIRIIIDGDSNFSEVTDDGAGNFASGAVLPSGGTVNYAARTLTGTTAGLTIFSKVEITFATANTAGEQLTVRAGDGSGTAAGGNLTLAAGVGTGGNGNLALQAGAQGSTSVVDRYIISGPSVSPTNTTATSIFSATVASNTMVGGSATVTIRATDGSDYQATTVTLNYAAINDAGTVTSQVTINGSNTATIASTGTLTVSASTVDGAGAVTIQITATSSLTPTTLDATYQVLNNSGQSISLFD